MASAFASRVPSSKRALAEKSRSPYGGYRLPCENKGTVEVAPIGSLEGTRERIKHLGGRRFVWRER